MRFSARLAQAAVEREPPSANPGGDVAPAPVNRPHLHGLPPAPSHRLDSRGQGQRLSAHAARYPVCFGTLPQVASEFPPSRAWAAESAWFTKSQLIKWARKAVI
jgi:hypothetical protein